MTFYKTLKYCNWIYTAILLLKSSYQSNFIIRTVNGSSILTLEDASTVEESIFEIYFCKSWYFVEPEDYYPLFPIINYNNLNDRVFGTKENPTPALIELMREFKFSKEEIVEICKLQKIKFDDYEFFITSIEQSIHHKDCSEGLSIEENCTKEHEIEEVIFSVRDYSKFFKFKYKNNIYWIKKNFENKEGPNLKIPELAFFDHKYIGKVYGMFLDNENLCNNYIITQYYEDAQKEMEIKLNPSRDNHNLIYNSLKMVLCVAIAVEYLNMVHGRVHGLLAKDHIIATKEGDRIIYKLINFDSSFKLGENEIKKIKNKRRFTIYASPEEKVGMNDDIKDSVFLRNSEVWSIGVILLRNFNFRVYHACYSHEVIIKCVHAGVQLYCKNCEYNYYFINERLKDLLSKILTVDYSERPNISECIELIYNRIIEEEKYLMNLYEEEEKKLDDEEKSFPNQIFKTDDERKTCREKLKDKRMKLNYRKDEFDNEIQYTSKDRNDYLTEKKTYETKKKFVDEISYSLNFIYRRRLFFMKRIEGYYNLHNRGAEFEANVNPSTKIRDKG